MSTKYTKNTKGGDCVKERAFTLRVSDSMKASPGYFVSFVDPTAFSRFTTYLILLFMDGFSSSPAVLKFFEQSTAGAKQRCEDR